MKTQYQAVDDPVLISIRKYIMKRAIKERGNHACLIWRSMFYFGHRIAILSTNNPIIKKTDASPRFVKRRGNLSILQHYLQNHLHCSQLLNKINFTDLMASAFSTFNFTVRNDVLLSDSELLFRNQQSPPSWGRGIQNFDQNVASPSTLTYYYKLLSHVAKSGPRPQGLTWPHHTINNLKRCTGNQTRVSNHTNVE